MTVLSSALLLATCACCPSFEPLAPRTSRGVDSGWGSPVNGVSLLATADSAVVDVGARVPMELFFRFWKFDSDQEVRALAANAIRGSWQLVLEASPNGHVYTRPAYRVGMPFFGGPESHVDLVDGTVLHRVERFHLTDGRGRQVPAGEYRAWVRHRNPGAESRPVWGDDDRMEEIPYAPGECWSGEVRSASFALTVRPKDADTTYCELPHGIVIRPRHGHLGWEWDPASFRPDTLVARPGFTVGFRARAVNPDAEDPASSLNYLGTTLSGIPRKEDGHWHGFGMLPDPRGEVGVSPVRVDLIVTVFETSEPPGHLWSPEHPGADYRVLRDYRVRGTGP